MKAQNELEICAKSLCNILPKKIKDNNNCGYFSSNIFQINNKEIKDDILKETNHNNMIKNNF